MITSFKHKSLELFFTKGSYKGVPAQYGSRIERMLDRLDASKEAEDMDLPGYKFQAQVTGELHINLLAKTPSTLTWRTITDEVSTKPQSQTNSPWRSSA